MKAIVGHDKNDNLLYCGIPMYAVSDGDFALGTLFYASMSATWAFLEVTGKATDLHTKSIKMAKVAIEKTFNVSSPTYSVIKKEKTNV